MTYQAIKTDLTKLQNNIAKRQRYCQQAVAAGDLDMAGMYEKDVKDLTDVFNAIESEDFETAFDLAEAMDTLVRDQIPVRLYNFLAKENGYN